jgi:hypothetical protein
MTKLSKIVAPLALLAAFGAAQAGELPYGDLGVQPTRASVSTAGIVGSAAASGELATGDLGKASITAAPSAGVVLSGQRIESAYAIGA